MTVKPTNVVVVDLLHVKDIQSISNENIPTKPSKWQVVKAANQSRHSQGQLKLNNLINDSDEEKEKNKSRTFRQRLVLLDNEKSFIDKKKIEEAKVLLKQKREEIEENLEKQNIKLDFYVHLLVELGKLPSRQQTDKYVNAIWKKRKEAKKL